MTVIGPISREDFFLMNQLRESIKSMSKRNPEKYSIAISKEQDILKEVMGNYLGKEAA